MEQRNFQYRNIDTIKPYDKNAKEHPTKQVEQIANSIKEFGFNQPIVVDNQGVIIVGHGRYEASKYLGLIEVPVIELNLNEEQAKSYRLADNKLNESPWKMDLVIEELKGLSLPMLDLTGFSRDLVLENEDNDDVVPEVPVNPKSKLGDVYELGRHKLIVGDSTKQEIYEKLMGGVQADMIFTDPPYNVNYKGRGENTSRGIENDHMEASVFSIFLVDFFKSVVNQVKNGAGWYIFHSSSTQDQFKEAMQEAGIEIKCQLIWNKPTASMGWGDYRWKHEPFYYAGKKGQSITFYGDRTHKTVVDFHASEKELIAWVKKEKRLEVQGLSTVWTMKRDKVNEYVHPTQKPVELISYAIVNSSKAGDIILDPFGGSGSTLIACEKTERIVRTVELDCSFADVIIQRYVDFTGNKEIIKNGNKEIWETSKIVDSVGQSSNENNNELVTTGE